ncbi:lipocalin-like domain-containing protein [Flavobacterium soli]|uniref:lipocalin family protein n=1 Tax=Flavobacterium soli TaxID=344881 RepID=UPI001FE1FE63|nr:lipocalin family protein [Flavobacterium soli]
MMRKAVLIVLVLVGLMSCQEKVKREDVAKINGYWEIEKVSLPDGNEKNYKINETIDYFEVKNDSGFRKKVTPQFDGKYLVNDEYEKVKVMMEGEKVVLEYTTEYSKWKEEVLEVSDEKLVLKNAAEMEYEYKRPTPFSVK